MRIVVVHNAYRSAIPSGENRVVEDQVSLLRGVGHEVETYFRSSDEIEGFSWPKKLALPLRPLRSAEDVSLFGRLLDRFKPDVVHLHNPYPLISPAVINVAAQRGHPVVQSIHNYRQVCVAGILFRDDAVCEECVGRTYPWPAIRHGCYRDSRLQTISMATAITVQRRTIRNVAQFLPVSEFVAGFLSKAGVTQDRVTVVPNAVPDTGLPGPVGDGFLFAGMLSRAKGIELLLEAWKRSDLGRTTALTIVGDGPERAVIEHAASEVSGVRYEGTVPALRVRQLIAASRVVVFPSLSYEALPTVVLEAFAGGRAVLAVEGGAVASLVSPELGWLAEPSVEAFSRGLRDANEATDIEARGRSARAKYEREFAPETIARLLGEVYSRVAADRSAEPD
jgi:glycosyltransferase involved in cell wall biosynthesis